MEKSAKVTDVGTRTNSSPRAQTVSLCSGLLAKKQLLQNRLSGPLCEQAVQQHPKEQLFLMGWAGPELSSVEFRVWGSGVGRQNLGFSATGGAWPPTGKRSKLSVPKATL